VTAYATLEIRQGAGLAVAERLAGLPQVLEAVTITGQGDLLCRVVARSNADLQELIDELTAVDGVQRTATVIALSVRIPPRLLPLIDLAATP